MNYFNIYEKLINRAKDRKILDYTEKHHIIPRCMNGTDDKENLVDLTAREHFIAHLLLIKIYPKKYSLIKAVMMMCVGSRKQQKEHRSMNRMYGWLREKFSKEMSISQSGDKNSQHGTIWIHNLDLKESKKIPKGDDIPEGWLKGRKINFDRDNRIKLERDLYKKEKENEKKILYKQKQIEYNEIFEDYKRYGYKFIVSKYNFSKTEGALYSKLKIIFGDFKKEKKPKIITEFVCYTCDVTFNKLSGPTDNFKYCSRSCAGKRPKKV